MSNNVQNAINGVAALGEISVIYYKAVISHGIDKTEAIALTKGFMDSWIRAGLTATLSVVKPGAGNDGQKAQGK